MSHWTTDQEQINQFTRSVGAQGYSLNEALQALGIEEITDLRGGIGQALNELQKVKKDTSGQAASALAVLPPDEHRALYQDDELAKRGRMVRAFAPWANNEKYPVSDTEIALSIHRGEMMGVDVFNPREVQIWKDKRGNIHFMLAYALMAQWANVTLGGHTRPKYTELTDTEKRDRGLLPADHAIRCEFIMKVDIPLIKILMDAKWNAVEARLDVTVVGFGTATAGEWGAKSQRGEEYFAPAARDKMFKLEKRAYIDALRCRYGEPSKSDIEALRRARGEDSITPDNWAVAQDEPTPAEAVMKAKQAARGVYDETDESPEDTLERNRAILHGDPDVDIETGEVLEGDAPQDEPAKEQLKEAKPKPRSWDEPPVKVLIDNNVAKNARNAVAILNMSCLDPQDDLTIILRWGQLYREARDSQAEKPEAAGIANAWLADLAKEMPQGDGEQDEPA